MVSFLGRYCQNSGSRLFYGPYQGARPGFWREMFMTKLGLPESWPVAVFCCLITLTISIAAFCIGIVVIQDFNIFPGLLWLFVSALTLWLSDVCIDWHNRPSSHDS